MEMAACCLASPGIARKEKLHALELGRACRCALAMRCLMVFSPVRLQHHWRADQQGDTAGSGQQRGGWAAGWHQGHRRCHRQGAGRGEHWTVENTISWCLRGGGSDMCFPR